MYVRSTFRRMVCRKWLPPMPYPSPSPPVTTTFISWLASAAPVATARARPCKVCMPYVLMYPGRLDEQPMPLMVITSCGERSSSTMACLSALSTPKSPQPGHQSGSALPFRSLMVSETRAGAFCGAATAPTTGTGTTAVICVSSLYHDLVDRHVRFRRPGQHCLDTLHDVVGHERLAVVLADVTVGHDARLGAQVSCELSAVVVLDDDRLLRPVDNAG